MTSKETIKENLTAELSLARQSAQICTRGADKLKNELDSLKGRIERAKREIKHCEARVLEVRQSIESNTEMAESFLKEAERYEQKLKEL